MISMPLALAVLGATSFEHVPSAKGRPEIVLIQTDAPTVSMLVSFGAGFSDDEGPGVTAQTQTALINANSAFPLRTWSESAFAAGASLKTSLSPRQANFVLSAPREEFAVLASPLVAALLGPRLSASAFAALQGRAPPGGSLASDTQLLMHQIEPLVPRAAPRAFWANPPGANSTRSRSTSGRTSRPPTPPSSWWAASSRSRFAPCSGPPEEPGGPTAGCRRSPGRMRRCPAD